MHFILRGLVGFGAGGGVGMGFGRVIGVGSGIGLMRGGASLSRTNFTSRSLKGVKTSGWSARRSQVGEREPRVFLLRMSSPDSFHLVRAQRPESRTSSLMMCPQGFVLCIMIGRPLKRRQMRALRE